MITQIPTAILAFLGTGDYKEEPYAIGDNSPITATFVQAAIAQWYPGLPMYVLVTPEAKAKHWDALRQVIPSVIGLDIPKPASEQDMWEIFNVLVNQLPPQNRLIVDITHGFRALPISALLALVYLRTLGRLDIHQILYGAWEAKKDGVTPVFDLTPFVSMLDWANAAASFQEYGDARKFDAILDKPRAPGKPIGEKLKQLSDALLTGRTGETQVAARELMKKIENTRSEFTGRESPLTLVLDGMREEFQPFAVPKEATTDALLQAEYEQVCWYIKHGHYLHGVTLAREWCVSIACQKLGKDWKNRDDRTEGERSLTAFRGSGEGGATSTAIPLSPESQAIVSRLFELRNNMAHWNAGATAQALRNGAVQVPDDLRGFAREIGFSLKEEAVENEELGDIDDEK